MPSNSTFWHLSPKYYNNNSKGYVHTYIYCTYIYIFIYIFNIYLYLYRLVQYSRYENKWNAQLSMNGSRYCDVYIEQNTM